MRRVLAFLSAVLLAANAAAAQPVDPMSNRGPGTGSVPAGAGVADAQQEEDDDDDGVAVPFEIVAPAAFAVGAIVAILANGGSSSSTPKTTD